MPVRHKIVWFSGMLLWMLSVLSSAVLVDDFESYNTGDVKTVANPPWQEVNAGTGYADIESADGNRYLTCGWFSTTGDYVRGAYTSIAPVSNTSTAVTLFTRIYAEPGDINHSFGLSDDAAPGTSMGHFEVQIIGANGSSASDFYLKANDAGSFVTYATLARDTWYNVWAVINQSTDTFDLYVTTGDASAGQGDKVAAGVHFRNGTTGDLVTFFAAAWDAAQNFRVDDIYLLDGLDLNNPRADVPLSPDINEDQFVDLDDLLEMAGVWLDDCQTPLWCGRADLDKNGAVNWQDFGRLSQAWLDGAIPGLAAWWPLDEASGYVAYDTVGGLDGVLNDTETDDRIASGDGFILGLDGQFESDGRGEYVYLPCVARDDFSLAFWLRTTDIAPAAGQWYAGKGLVDAIATGLRSDFGTALLGDKAAFGVNGTATGDVTIQSTTAVNDGYWHHITATRDSTSGAMTLYVDGLAEAAATGAFGSLTGPSRMLVGSINLLNGRYLRGYFDDIRVYDRVLTPAEIAQLAQNQHPPVTPKKGVSSKNLAIINTLNIDWFYNWGMNRPSSPAEVDSSLDYVPMKWGLSGSLDNLDNAGQVYYLLGFNEPDHAEQADMTVAQAIAQWPQLQVAADQRNLLLGSPATAHYASSWIQDFMAQVDAPGSGLRVDFMAVHWYRAPDADELMNNLTWVHNTWGRDVWITEFNVADWSGSNTYTQEQSYTFMAEALFRMEKTAWVKRYAIFPWDGDTNASLASPIFEPGTTTLTPLGRLYNAWDGDVRAPRTHTWYYLHNKASHRRVTGSGTTVETTTIWSMDNAAQWELIPVDQTQYSIRNRSSGRLFAYDDTAGVFYAADASYTGTDAQWTLTASQHGWYYMDHPASGKRLSRSGDALVMTVSASTGDSQHWRLIKP